MTSVKRPNMKSPTGTTLSIVPVGLSSRIECFSDNH
jgi:hypothetical protein